MKKIFSKIMVIFSIIIILAILFLIGLKIFGCNIYIVKTNSMGDLVPAGSLIVVKEKKEYKENDIVSFMYSKDVIVTHQIIDTTNYPLVITKGTMNETADAPINVSQIVGVKLFSVPVLGYILSIFKDFRFYIIVFLFVLLFYIGKALLKTNKGS